jgi:hypothetical protein
VSPLGLTLAHAQTYNALVAEKKATAAYLASPTVENKNILLSAMNTVSTQAQAPGNVPGASNAQAIEQAAIAAYNNTPAPAANVNSMSQSTAAQVVNTATAVANPAPAATPAAPAPAASVSTGDNFVPLTSIPAIVSIGQASDAADLAAFLNNIYKICIGIAATLAVLQIMRAGFMYMGGDSITETKQARMMIYTSIGGLVLVLSPAIVFGILNPNILSLQIGGSAGLASFAPPTTSGESSTTLPTGAAPTCTTPIANGAAVNSANDQACCNLQSGCKVTGAIPAGGSILSNGTFTCSCTNTGT